MFLIYDFLNLNFAGGGTPDTELVQLALEGDKESLY